METSDILKRVRQIEIKTRGLSSNIFAGQYHSAFKGKGMSFSEVREYQYGDDVRDIDWNVTARQPEQALHQGVRRRTRADGDASHRRVEQLGFRYSKADEEGHGDGDCRYVGILGHPEQR